MDCYGYNLYGQSNDYTGGDAIAVSAGLRHTCVLKSNGNVICYGHDQSGQSNDYTGGDAIAVSAGDSHTCILKSNGEVDCYGNNAQGQSNDYTGGDAIAVSAGSSHTCILKSNGNVDCYGGNLYGESNDYLEGDAIGVSVGWGHTCILKSDGVDCYGWNAYNQSEDYTCVVVPVVSPAGCNINTCQDLQNMANDLSGDYSLCWPIDCAGFDFGDGNGFKPVGDFGPDGFYPSGDDIPFIGSFDGNGFTITGLDINRPLSNGVGLFGLIFNNTIQNVGLIDVDIKGYGDVGSLVGRNVGTVNNSHSTGSVNGRDLVGGLIGVNAEVSYAGGINSTGYSGGINSTGYSVGAIINNSYFTGVVNSTLGDAGGLVGGNVGTISNSYSTGNVTDISGENTTTMKTQSTFTNAGWNFTDIWTIDSPDGTSYPYFQGQITLLTLSVTDDVVSKKAQLSPDDILIKLNNIGSKLGIQIKKIPTQQQSSCTNGECHLILGDSIIRTPKNKKLWT